MEETTLKENCVCIHRLDMEPPYMALWKRIEDVMDACLIVDQVVIGSHNV